MSGKKRDINLVMGLSNYERGYVSRGINENNPNLKEKYKQHMTHKPYQNDFPNTYINK